mgnify:CR=1 FL=1
MEVEYHPKCQWDSVEIGTATLSATKPICGLVYDYGFDLHEDWDENYSQYDEREYPYEYFQWTALESRKCSNLKL